MQDAQFPSKPRSFEYLKISVLLASLKLLLRAPGDLVWYCYNASYLNTLWCCHLFSPSCHFLLKSLGTLFSSDDYKRTVVQLRTSSPSAIFPLHFKVIRASNHRCFTFQLATCYPDFSPVGVVVIAPPSSSKLSPMTVFP